MADHLARAEDFEAKAEKKLSGWGLFGSKYDDAADLFDKSANSYKLSKSCTTDRFFHLLILFFFLRLIIVFPVLLFTFFLITAAYWEMDALTVRKFLSIVWFISLMSNLVVAGYLCFVAFWFFCDMIFLVFWRLYCDNVIVLYLEIKSLIDRHCCMLGRGGARNVHDEDKSVAFLHVIFGALELY